MTDYNWCHGPECHTKSTQSRVRGSGTNKVLRTRKIKVRDYADTHWFQGWENHFCNVSCFFDYMKIHYQEIVKIAPCIKALETPIEVEKTKSQDYRYRYSDGESVRVPYISTSTRITKVDND